MRNSKYTPEIVERICELVSADEYTIKEICSIVGINPDTWFEWKKVHADFSEKVKKAEDALIEKRLKECNRSLSKLITGYEATETVTDFVNIDGKPVPRGIRQVKKHIPPSLGAIIHYQTNKDPDNWANKQRTEITGKDGAPIALRPLTEEELDALRRMSDGE